MSSQLSNSNIFFLATDRVFPLFSFNSSVSFPVLFQVIFLYVFMNACTVPNVGASEYYEGKTHESDEETKIHEQTANHSHESISVESISVIEPRAIPTFESMGLYWKPEASSKNNECQIRYRVSGTREWIDGLPLWYDERNSEYRGSLVHLKPNTLYEVELELQRTRDKRILRVRTWSQEYPVSKRIILPEESGETLAIEKSGTPDGYVLYTHQTGARAVIDVRGLHNNNIHIDASHIIIRGLMLKNASKNAIRISKNSHDVIIEQNDISGWGRLSPDGWGMNYDSAIYANGHKQGLVKRLVIQRNKIHHPRTDSNAWDEYRTEYKTYHPMGPQGITLRETGGNNVIRYNEIYSDDAHMFNDCIGGAENYSEAGSPNRDSDIYGNVISHCWDDAIEAEGGNSNVRIWNNYIDLSFVMIAVAPTQLGPIYIWRNVVDRSRKTAIGSMEAAKRGVFLKTQSKIVREKNYGDGRIFVFHNTLLQRDGMHQGVSGGPADLTSRMSNLVTRNNIFHVNADFRSSISDSKKSANNDFDYDLFNGKIIGSLGQEQHGIKGTPIYDPDNRIGEFSLLPLSPGHDAGLFVPNFSDGFTGASPDMGAHEANSPRMQFGVDAYR